MTEESYQTLIEISPLLTDHEISKALTDWFKEAVTFTKWEYVDETGKGDSYLSEVIRIRIYGKTDDTLRHIQVVLKTIPKNICRRLTYRSHDFFKNEINFYTKVLPTLLSFQAKKQMTDPFLNYTNLFLALSDGVHDVICLEDATLQNYGAAVRQEGIDLEHCKLTLKAIAKFHAISFALRDQNPDIFNSTSIFVDETYYDARHWLWYERFWRRISSIAIDAVEREYPNSIYVDKVKGFAVPERYQDMIKAVQDKTNAVFSHGDSWTNNFLYKYDNGTVVDAKIIDFQLTRCASPVLDVTFMIYACTDQELRLKHYNDLLKYYYEVLAKQIKEMGSDPDVTYSWDSFMTEVKKYSYFGLAFSFESTPFIILAPEDAISMEMTGEEKRNIDDFWCLPPIKTKEGRLREANNVVHCVDQGYI
ncbi:uncharacterized protein LOC126968404 isoform X1 [Leptidea sinapis]|uniref:uncharacterized protein LOC126968404 isoform X1 n=1 Tax=Leptidea sinapis TaxID=189913 RepID=UPI0021400A83|nr:uncharacterized protein LOC126968404 isoform X1 [Leptidea sinapis]